MLKSSYLITRFGRSTVDKRTTLSDSLRIFLPLASFWIFRISCSLLLYVLKKFCNAEKKSVYFGSLIISPIYFTVIPTISPLFSSVTFINNYEHFSGNSTLSKSFPWLWLSQLYLFSFLKLKFFKGKSISFIYIVFLPFWTVGS